MQKPDYLKAPHCLYVSSLALVIHTVLVYSGDFSFLTEEISSLYCLPQNVLRKR